MSLSNIPSGPSAGNAGKDIDIEPQYPAAYDSANIITVTGTTRADELFISNIGGGGANWGENTVDLAAPGSQIEIIVSQHKPIGKLFSTTATSFAAPFVTGTVALMMAEYPDASHLKIKSKILDNVDPVESLEGKVLTGGRLNLYNAIVPPQTITVEFDNDGFPASVTIKTGDTVSWDNVDTAAHTVTSGTPADGPDGIFDSDILIGGATFEVTFDESGSYDYFCMVHPWKVGNVQVN